MSVAVKAIDRVVVTGVVESDVLDSVAASSVAHTFPRLLVLAVAVFLVLFFFSVGVTDARSAGDAFAFLTFFNFFGNTDELSASFSVFANSTGAGAGTAGGACCRRSGRFLCTLMRPSHTGEEWAVVFCVKESGAAGVVAADALRAGSAERRGLRPREVRRRLTESCALCTVLMRGEGRVATVVQSCCWRGSVITSRLPGGENQ